MIGDWYKAAFFEMGGVAIIRKPLSKISFGKDQEWKGYGRDAGFSRGLIRFCQHLPGMS